MGGSSRVRSATQRLLVATCLSTTAVAAMLGAAPGASAEAGTWRATGSLPAARSNHTATVLGNGKVLVAGGQVAGADSDGRTTSALLYDPATGAWSTTGSMTFARYRHTATLLTNGKVLVAGGFSSDEGFSAELYDPAAGTWSLATPMSDSRYDHTATRLADGTVLVVGGEFFFTSTPTAEIYEPLTGTWSFTGPMVTRRTDHAAVLMDQAPCGALCGHVLVTGGQVEPDPTRSATVATNSAEVYNPATRTWSSAGVHPARSHHTSTLLSSGQVLLSGGTSGSPAGPATGSARLFDPVARAWSATGSLADGRWDHTATRLPTGEVLVTGGSAGGGGELSSAELYNPLTGSWSPAGAMGVARSNHSASLLQDDHVLVAGGSFNNSSAELYGPPLPVVSVGSVAVYEGDAGGRAATFTVSLSKPSPLGITVAYATADAGATAPADYTTKAGTISFAAGATSSTVKVPVTGDKIDEAEESFTLELSSPTNAAIGTGSAVGTVVDDDPTAVTGPRLTIGDVSVHEGDAGSRVAVFNVSLSRASSSYVSVSYATAKATAVGSDFKARSGTLTFAPGITSLNLKVAITPDDEVEADETLSVKLSGASGALVTDGIGQGTILDDD